VSDETVQGEPVKIGFLGRPRPLPQRLLPALAGGVVVLLALPVFLVAGWPLAGWALGLVLFVAAQALGVLLQRMKLGAGNVASSGVVGFGMMFRSIAVMIVAVAVAAGDAAVGLSAAVVYALAYSLELGLGVLAYYSGEPRA
jgi:hypothetical protein